jgi:hypothetical protein
MRGLIRIVVPAVLTLLALAGPAVAHVAGTTLTLPAAVLAPAEPDATVQFFSAAPTSPTLPWYLPAAVALVAMAVRRRPQQTLAISLALVLAVFAFENALHSVHHGFDAAQQEECAVAAVSAQLSGLQVDGVALACSIPPIAGATVTALPVLTLDRFLSPDQGRAPPSAIL